MVLPEHDHHLSLHHELVRLTRGLGGGRLAIADGVERLESLGGISALGFPNVDAYARERLGRAGRWVGDARTLSRRLAALPLLREAYLSGRLSMSKVELVARHLVQGERGNECDEEEAIAMATSLTVRDLRRRLGSGETCPNDDTRRHWVHLTRNVERLDAVAFEGSIRLMEAIGETTRSAAIEGLLAEGLTTLLNRFELAPDLVNRIASTTPGNVATPSRAIPDVAAAEPNTDIGPALGSESGAAQIPRMEPETRPPTIDPAIVDIGLLDIELRAISAELMRRDLRLGELALEGERRGFVFAHGHPTFDDYYRDALGVAPSSMAGRIALARRIRLLPRLKEKMEGGAIGFETATLLARVATPSTEAAWLALADISTTKIFRERVDAAELYARTHGLPLEALAPPTEAQVDDARELERRVLTMVLTNTTEDSDVLYATGVPDASDATSAGPEPQAGPMSVSELADTTTLGTVPLRVTLPNDLAAFWCELEVLHADADFPAGSFVAFLVASTLDTWRGLTRLPAYGDIYLRDRFRCQSPTCRSRNCTPHHIVFRSRGGGDEPSNLVSLCDRCHLSLVHGGHLTVTGLAPHVLRWSARTYHVDA